jgi:L-threonylcarbamoyladenylate synthase
VRYRHGLYASLFQLDKLALSAIWVETPPEEPAWLDIQDRLSKASS